MKKITLLILALLFSFSGYSQFEEGFESSNLPDLATDTWNLGTVNLGSNGVWGVFDNGVGLGQSWNINNGVATPPLVYEGANAAYMNRENIGAGNTAQDFLATPLLTIPATGQYQLRFFTRTTINGDLGTKYKIMVAESPDSAPVAQNNPANYVLVKEWGENDLTATFNIYEEKLVDLSAYVGKKIYVAFVMEAFQPAGGLNSDRWLVDKVRIGEKCADPTGGIATATETTANLSWNANGGISWELEIIPLAATPTGTNLITVNTTPAYLATATTTPAAPLANSTQYKYYVRATCGNGFTSAWAGPYAFTTSSPGLTCSSPIVIGSTPYSTTDTTAAYGDTTDVAQPAACAGTATNYMTGNDVFYSYTPTTTGAISITMTPTGNWSGIFVYDGCANVGLNCVAGVANNGGGVREIPSLLVEAGHQYIIVISTNAAPQTIGYTMVIQTLNCAPPTSLTAASTGPTSANLSWANPGGASSWEVFVQPQSAPIPATAGITANTNTNFGVTTLADGTPLTLGCYQYWARANCGDGTFSPWAGPYPFCTTTCSSGCNYNFIMTDTFGDGWNGNTMTITQGASSTTIGATFTDGVGPITIPVTLCDGDFTLTWNAGGAFPGEVGVSVVNPFGQVIFVKAPGTGAPNTLLYSGIADCTNPACLPPTGLTSSSPTTTGITLNWTPTGPETAWQVLALPAGSAPPTSTSTGWVDAPSHPFVLGGLTISTAYDFYVRAVCSPTSSSPWAGPLKANTSVCEPVNQCLYSFVQTDSFGDGWNGGTMIVVQNGVTVATLTGPTNADDQNPITVQVPLCHGVAFDLIWNTAGTFPGEMGISITSFLGDVLYTKAPGTGAAGPTPLYSGTGECIPPTCLKPTNVTIGITTLNTVSVSWIENNPGVTSWDIIVLPATAPAPTASSTGWINVSTNPFVYPGLNAATQYKAYVRSVCSSTDSSFWSIGAPFNTQVCLPANVCEYTFVMVDSFGDSWNGNTMSVTQNGILMATLTGPTAEDDTNPVSQIVTLCNNLPFELFWNAGGAFAGEVGVSIVNSTGQVIFVKAPGTGDQDTQLFTGTVTCVPLTCPKPVQVTATNITQTSALISWIEAGTATAWEILILPFGSPTPVTSGIQATNPYLATGLTAGTAYTVYVRAICAANDLSNWSLAYNFGTPPVNDDCSNAIFAAVNQDLSCNQVTPGTIIGATGSAPATTCSVGSNDDAWFFFTATAVSHIISFNNTSGTAALSYAVYNGGCNGLTQVGCSEDNSETITGLTIGQTYYIRVFSESLQPQFVNQFNLCISTVPCAAATPFCTGQVVTYANTTGVLPGLGSFDCLGSSPNPAFFFLQVSQAGPLNYLMTQSTSSGGGPNLDVDYALWGPFISNEAACAVIPNDNPISCSYSTAATESFNIANAQLCQIYVVMITNFSDDPGFITFTQTNPSGGGQTICYPFNTFNYTANQYCQNQANPTPTLAPGAVAGTYTSTPSGLVIDSVTGVINLAASTPGNYVVTSTTVPTTGGICPSIPNITTVRSVTITAVPNATIAYAAPQYCNSQDAAVPAIETGTDTGTYSSTPGLFINAQTGAITPSLSTPGSYTVTYTVAATGGCPAFTTTTPVEIILAPNIPFINNVNSCDATYTLPALTVGNYFTQPNGGGTPLFANDVINTSQTIYVYAASAQCTDERSFTVTLNPVTADDPADVAACINYALPALSANNNYFTGPGGTGTALFANDLISSTQTIYVFTQSGACTDENSFDVTIGSIVADVLNDVTVCDSYTLPVLSANNAYYSGPGGTGSVLTGAVTTSQTVYIWAQLGTCTDQSSFVVTVNTTPDVQPVANVASCDGYVLPALAVGHYYSAPSGGGTQLDGQTITTDQTIYVYAQSGTAPAICFDQESFTVTITTSPVADDPLDVDACASYGLPALTVGNYFTAPAGGGTPHFAGDVITTSQTLYVYAIAGTCPDENSFDISIIADPSFTIDSGCHGSEYVLEVVPAQGSFDAATASYTWSVTGDGQILSGNGTQAIVISGAGDYTVMVTAGPAECDHSETVTVDSTGCTIQKGISPNGDGMNDYFDLEGQNVAKLDIFNRYGTIVYKKSNYSTQWHGQSDGGDELPDGTYYYVIERAGGETKTGWIYINRERN